MANVIPKPTLFDEQAVQKVRRELKLDPQHLRRLRTVLLKHRGQDEAALAELPEGAREPFAQHIALHSLSLHKRCDSQQDGATKLLFRTCTGLLIESVILRIASGRTTLCVSSQVGCAAACDFCATGKMGVAQNLTAEEILDQVVQANQLLAAEDRRIRNLVFMGMGEPFHNEQQLYHTLDLLTSAEYFNHSPRRVLVSTVGIPDAMVRFAYKFPKVNLALSLHSARQDTRERIIPLAKKYSLEQLRDALMERQKIQGTESTVMIEYLMLASLNDSPDDAAALIAWLDGLRAHVNLIPCNPIDDAPHLTGSDRETIEHFSGLLKQARLTTTIRYSLGADVAAACGQLVQEKNREIVKQLKVIQA
ncbi:23S rRNA (adenine(2503)-C(2))-methyltransferase RlmN [Adhaeretor mobilis]|uniref:23S rRNA (adenine(2503)-C(2))-methyltransferase RlmN n=1 Tax=Adhaeretor mobilis TaxID=1930276 RepID=UPI001FEB8C0C|nr:23S rRNA (adenine(2503)-C(2))-methyltransferase RlmN [Adhaeretor mobilis]